MTDADASKLASYITVGNDIANISPITDTELQKFCDHIVLCLRIYGKLDEATARQRLDASGICSPEHTATDLSRSLLFHEEPYYWAMELLHGREFPRWWDEPSLGKLWPPPAEYHHPDWPHAMLRHPDQE